MRVAPDLPPSLPTYPGTPTLNSDPEVLLCFPSWVLGQAGIEPRIGHLWMELDEQLFRLPHTPKSDFLPSGLKVPLGPAHLSKQLGPYSVIFLTAGYRKACLLQEAP